VKFFTKQEPAKLYAIDDRNTWIWKFMANTCRRRAEMVKGAVGRD
jgi:hypothetical protein